MSFIFIKIIIRAIKLKFNIIFVDESNFKLQNPNFKTWIKNDEFPNYGYKNNDKINFLLAVSANKVINYKFTNQNTNTKVFKSFMLDTIDKISDEDKSNTLFIMDNHTSHISKEFLRLVKKKIKILYNVPYESPFNCVELSFRHLKNITYKQIFPTIRSLIEEVERILDDKKFEETLYKNYIETIKKYVNYSKYYIDKDLNIIY